MQAASEPLSPLPSLLDPAGPPLPEVGKLAREWALSSASPAELTSRAASAIASLESALFRLSLVGAAETEADLERLLRGLVVMDVLRDHLFPRLGEAPPDSLVELRGDLLDLRSAGVAEDPAYFRLASAQSRAVAERLDRIAAEPPDMIDPARGLRDVAGTAAELDLGGISTRDPHVERVRERLYEGLTVALSAADPVLRDQALFQLGEELDDRIGDAIAESQALEDDHALARLEQASLELRGGEALAAQFHDEGLRVRLAKGARRLKAEALERRVRAEAARRLPGKGARIVEWLTLLATLGLLVVLVLHAFIVDSETKDRTLARIDTALSLVLLSEFVFRWSCSGFHRQWFARHLLTDFVPALPFSWLGALLESSAAAAHSFEWLRLLRIPQFLLALRFLRPTLQALRVLGVSLKGLDRLVRRHADLLNRDFVLFESAREEVAEAGLSERLRPLRDRTRHHLRQRLRDPRGESLRELARARLLALEDRAEHAPPPEPRIAGAALGASRTFRAEDVAARLLTLERSELEPRFGANGARRLARSLQSLDLPVVRHLPLLRRVVPGLRSLSPLEAVETAARRIGAWIDRTLDRFRFVADLQGVVTGSQLLDRVGSGLVKATYRPAVRLLMFGILVALISGIIGIFGGEEGVLGWLRRSFSKVLGPSLLVLGAVCLVVQGFGRWFVRIAGRTTERFHRVSEAHGINLIKFRKLAWREGDLRFLGERVLSPELAVRDPSCQARELDQLRQYSPSAEIGRYSATPGAALREELITYYLDYLDSGLLHDSQTKVTEQFLGNLHLESLRKRRPLAARDEGSRLRDLDLSKDRAIPTGPYLWFLFITESLSQHVARLILEYSARAIPCTSIPALSESERAAYQVWLAHGRSTPPTIPPPRGTLFSALHFLAADPARDLAVEAEFGPAVRNRLVLDREEMIRSVFASYPYERLPRSRRTVNPYHLWFTWVGGGRILLLPFRCLFRGVVLAVRSLRFFRRILREQLDEAPGAETTRQARGEYQTAVRKINRMHRPLFLEILALRTSVDPELLGIALEGELHPSHALQLARDLDLIGAREYEREIYRRKQEESLASRDEFQSLLRARLGRNGTVREALGVTGEALGNDAEAARAVMAAWHTDERQVRTILTSRRRFEVWAKRPDPSDRRPPRRLPRKLARAWRLLRSELLPTPFQAQADERVRTALERGEDDSRRRLLAILEHGSLAAAELAAWQHLHEVARHPRGWSEDLFALRSIAALLVLEIENSRRLVADLGGLTDRGSVTAS